MSDFSPLIVVDASEMRSNSRTRNAFESSGIEPMIVDWLEEMTGADILITAFPDMPVVPPTLRFHLESKQAVLIQVKWGSDLTSSIPDGRLVKSIAKMNSHTNIFWQKILMPVGYFYKDNSEKVLLGKKLLGKKPTIYWSECQSRCNWKALETSLRRWSLRGGTVLSNINDSGDFISTLRAYCIDLQELKPETEIWEPVKMENPKEHVLQQVTFVKDSRLLVASIPGVGPALTNALSHAIAKKKNLKDPIVSGAEMLDWIGRLPDYHYKVAGWGSKTIQNAREWIGLSNTQTLAVINHSPEEIEVMKQIAKQEQEVQSE